MYFRFKMIYKSSSPIIIVFCIAILLFFISLSLSYHYPIFSSTTSCSKCFMDPTFTTIFPSIFSVNRKLLSSLQMINHIDSYEDSEFQLSNNTHIFLNSLSSSIDLSLEIKNSFMQYALSTILKRALPDARDGLKPVHRRILFAMKGLGLLPNSSYRKCARVVGEVLGKYHPHGDTAVYDALVRLAQSFSTGTPLIDGQGNFGSVDNDPPAAMRYTECRLTHIAYEAFFEDILYDTVKFIPNFDDKEVEPSVLPCKIPMLLLNGSSGIAVGMATNVPPHNLCELMNACLALTSSRENGFPPVTDEELCCLVPAPDFPTGASILGLNDTKKLYMTSKGGILLRATTHIETIQKSSSRRGKINSHNAIIVTQLPYQVNKSALMEKIARLVQEQKLEGIANLRDESDREGTRMVIEMKKDAVVNVVKV